MKQKPVPEENAVAPNPSFGCPTLNAPRPLYCPIDVRMLNPRT